MRSALVMIFLAASILLPATVPLAAGPTTSVQGEYLMTLYVPIADAHDIDDTLRVVNHPDGWVEGLRLRERSFRHPATP
jgi:hypothetical protein